MIDVLKGLKAKILDKKRFIDSYVMSHIGLEEEIRTAELNLEILRMRQQHNSTVIADTLVEINNLEHRYLQHKEIK